MWYSTGTIGVSTDGTVATGTGTSWLSNVRVGDGLTISGSSSIHEVTNIASDTTITFKPAYTGATGSGKAYSIAPIQGYVKDLADQAKQLIQSIGANATKLANMPTSINGKTFDGTAAIVTPSWGEARNLTIGAATKSVDGSGDVSFNAAEMGLLSVGDFGIGGRGNEVPLTLNDLTQTGFYRVLAGQASSKNGPPVAQTAGGMVIHLNFGTNNRGQIWNSISTATTQMWFRHLNAGVWSDWQQIDTFTSNMAMSYGVGSTSGRFASGNMDTFIEGGFYRVSSGNIDSNSYPGAISGDTIIVSPYGSNFLAQIATKRNNDIYFRYCNSGTWQPWVKIWHEGNLATIGISDVGAYCLARNTLTGNVGWGTTIAGSNLRVAGVTTASGTALPGTWRAMGSGISNESCIYQRVS